MNMTDKLSSLLFLRLAISCLFILGLGNMVLVMFRDVWVREELIQAGLSITVLVLSLLVVGLTWYTEHTLKNSATAFAFVMVGTVSFCFFILIMPAVLLQVVPSNLYQSQLAYTSLLIVLLIHTPLFSLSEQRKAVQRLSLVFSVLLSVVMVLSIMWTLGGQYPVLPEIAMIFVFGMLILVDVGGLFFLPQIYEAISEFTADAKRAQSLDETEETQSSADQSQELDSEEAVAHIHTEDVSNDPDR